MRLNSAQIAKVRELRYIDGYTYKETALAVGCPEQDVGRIAPGWPGKISNVAVREAFLASGLSATCVAQRMGWRSGTRPDASRVLRALGLRPTVSHGRRNYRRLIDAEMAGDLAEAIGVERWEVEEAAA